MLASPQNPELPGTSPGRYRRAMLLWKTAAVSAVVIATNVIGNYALSRGLREVGGIESWSPLPYIRAFANVWVALGVFFMLTWLISRLMLLSWADLSYVLPVTAFAYVLSAVAGAIYLNEHVSVLHWAGICVITVGTALVAITYPETSESPDHRHLRGLE